MSHITEIPVPCLETPLFGFRPDGTAELTVAAYLRLFSDVLGRPQASISCWEPQGMGSPHWDWRAMGQYYLTSDDVASRLQILGQAWMIHDDPPSLIIEVTAEPLERDRLLEPFDDTHLHHVWQHIASALHAAGILVPYEQIDADQLKQTDEPSFLSNLADLGRLDATALQALLAD